MNPSALTLGVAMAAALRSSTPAAPAQDPQQRPPIIIGAEVEVVSVPVIVHDKAGRFVAGLKKEDIQILEDGVPQEITYLASSTGEDRIPLSIALTLDTSGSMQGSIKFLKESATYFTGKLELTDQALVVQFNESVKSSSSADCVAGSRCARRLIPRPPAEGGRGRGSL